MINKKEGQNEWTLPGWPWELELLALIFVIAALALPLYIHGMPSATPQGTNLANEALQEQSGLLWSVGILGLYVLHLLFARGSIDLISTPFTHLFTPLLFAMLAYYRTYVAAKITGVNFPMATGSASQYLLLAFAVIFITLILARLQMARYMMGLVQTKWEVISPTRFDKSYLQLIPQIKPLFYAPRYYRASEQGILVEGWFYVMVIPFRLVQSIGAMNHFSLSVAGNYFATSGHALIRLELRESVEPLFISPADRDGFLKYCIQHVVRTKHGTGPGTSPGTLGNTRTQRISMGQTQRIASPEATPPAAHKS